EDAAEPQISGEHGSTGVLPSQKPTTQIAGELQIRIATDFRDAFRSAVAFSQQGDIVLLSPGCASYGWFQDFRERGDLFSALARDWSPNT
ncbi:MAG: hypothetical protein WCO86_16125, partial [Planctomycetota bacterium]